MDALEYIKQYHKEYPYKEKINEFIYDEKKHNYNYYYCKYIDEDTKKILKHLDCSFKDMLNLKLIRCTNLNLKSIPDILINLEYLDCSNNLITSLPDSLLQLKELNCSNNKISFIPNTYVKLQHLNCINTDINIVPSSIKHLKHLISNNKKFVFTDNLITLEVLKTTTKLPKSLINLKSLDVSSSNIDKIPKEYDKLEILIAHCSKVKKLPYIHSLKRVISDKEIRMKNRKIIDKELI